MMKNKTLRVLNDANDAPPDIGISYQRILSRCTAVIIAWRRAVSRLQTANPSTTSKTIEHKNPAWKNPSGGQVYLSVYGGLLTRIRPTSLVRSQQQVTPLFFSGHTPEMIIPPSIGNSLLHLYVEYK